MISFPAFLVLISFDTGCLARADDSDAIIGSIHVRNEKQSLIRCHANCNEPAIVEGMIGIVESDRKGIKEYVVASSNEMWCFR